MYRLACATVFMVLVSAPSSAHAQRLEAARTALAAVRPAHLPPASTGAVRPAEPEVPGYVSAIGVRAIVGAVLAGTIVWYAVRQRPCDDYCAVDDRIAPVVAAFPGALLGMGVGWIIEQGRKPAGTNQ